MPHLFQTPWIKVESLDFAQILNLKTYSPAQWKSYVQVTQAFMFTGLNGLLIELMFFPLHGHSTQYTVQLYMYMLYVYCII